MKLTAASILLAMSSVAVAQSGVWTLGSNCPKSTQTTCGSGVKDGNKQIWVCTGNPLKWKFQTTCSTGMACKDDYEKNWAWCE
ncbi:hypothetical protein O988_08486 [Pseudogymnoascus sp. VKM F-3808]|nr:hypothetical protein O988_08486 [Pseudogymnoascus sp. VKM F-3808]